MNTDEVMENETWYRTKPQGRKMPSKGKTRSSYKKAAVDLSLTATTKKAVTLQGLGEKLAEDPLEDEDQDVRIDRMVHEAQVLVDSAAESSKRLVDQVVGAVDSLVASSSNTYETLVKESDRQLAAFLVSLDEQNVSSFDPGRVRFVPNGRIAALGREELKEWIQILHDIFDTERAESFRRMLRNRSLTSLQLRMLLKFSNLDFERRPIASIGYSHLCDPENFEEVVVGMFKFEADRDAIRAEK